MSADNLSVFTGSRVQTVQGGPSMSPHAVANQPKKPLEELADKFRASLAATLAEDDKLRAENKLGAPRALDFPTQVVLEENPQPKLRVQNGVNTFLTVTIDPVYHRLGFAKYAFITPEMDKLITRMITDAGYNLDPKQPNCLELGQFIRPSGF